MKRTLPLFALLAIVFATGCAKKDEAAKTEETQPAAAWKVSRNTNGDTIITLDTATQNQMGLQTSPVSAVSVSPEIKAYGRVIDPTPLATAVADLAAARATANASQKDLERIKKLAQQNNASTRALQTAEAAAQRDAAQVEVAQTRLRTGWGGDIAGREDLRSMVELLTAGTNALAKLDLPAGEVLESPPTGARLVALSAGNESIEAKLLGKAPMVDPQMQGEGFLFLVESNQSRLAPGAAVTGYLSLPGNAESGVTVPRDAVLRFNGSTWVFMQTGEQTFQRAEIKLERPLADGWFVRKGLHAGDKLVTVGAQTLLSEELSSSGFQSGRD